VGAVAVSACTGGVNEGRSTREGGRELERVADLHPSFSSEPPVLGHRDNSFGTVPLVGCIKCGVV